MSRAAAGLLLLVVAVVSIVAAGCGSGPEMDRFAGDWQRLSGGVADHRSTLRIAGDGTTASLVFAEAGDGGSVRAEASLAGDELSAELQAGAVEGPAPAPHASAEAPVAASPGESPAVAASGEVPVRLSLDESGDVLTVQMVTPDEVIVPLWRYRRLGS